MFRHPSHDRERGSVTIFLLVIILIVFVFHAVLIDYARIMVADQVAENAVKTGVRSVASSYDGGLQGFGMYSYQEGDESAQAIFEKVVQENLGETVAGDGIFKLVSPKLDRATVDLGDNRELANNDIFERQILEEMKYRAPIEFTLSIIDKFTIVADAAEDASNFIDISEKIADDYDDRENKLQEIQDKLKEAKDLAAAQNTGMTDGSGNTFTNIKTLPGIPEYYDEFKDALKAEEEKEEESGEGGEESGDEEKDGKKEAEKYYRSSKNLVNDLSSRQEDIRQLLAEIKTLAGETVELNQKIETTINEHKNENAAAYENVRDHRGENAPSDQLNDAEQEIEGQNIEDVLYTDELSTLEEKIDAAIEKSDTLNTDLSAYKKHFTSIEKLENAGQSNLKSDQLSQTATGQYENIEDAHDYIQGDWRKRGGDEDKAQEEADQNADNANKELEKAMQLAESAVADAGAYESLLQAMQKYGAYNNAVEEDVEVDGSLKKAGEMMDFMDTIINKLSQLLTSARDELYVNEYIMTRFVSTAPYDIKDPNSYLLENKEIEYIIYGHHVSGANYAAMIRDLFLIRFALRLIDAFNQKSVRAGSHPVVVAIIAISYALEKAIGDVNALTSVDAVERNSVPLISNELTKGIFFNYNDYLRLFLLLTMNKEEKLNRIKAMLDDKTSSDLTQRPTYITGEAEVSVKLWFLPGVAQLLNTAGVLPGKVNDDELTIKKEAVFSY
ncbi:hypothetical protein G4V62_05570 [Bacillaceae bacterium SIJ1]|uniref:DUF5702 domain-containing protein n=1 Tax=Litoribacterium kuwaitense TaxID=1398745 RepID=UPI0013E9DD59|nr:DUF5702 domain-containing protein [Litoribacterium kuwaitense]NGP44450.1 hypothetical protein [Litoribacterium kuwaitense]